MDKIILINPVSMKQTELIPDQISKLKKAIINLPLVGTFLYHRMNTPIKMNLHLETKCFKNADHISTSMRNSFYSSAHSKNGQGKYLFSSILGNFLCQDMKHAHREKIIPSVHSIHTCQSNQLRREKTRLSKRMVIPKNIAVWPYLNQNMWCL